jgi:nonsense-mediated mRNA decay protein 3
MIEYVILDVVPRGNTSGKLLLADVQCARNSDFGTNDTCFYTVTHLGNILKPGDLCLGYDYSTANFNEDDVKSLKRYNYPDVVLVRKSYPKDNKKKKARVFKLKTLEKEKADMKKGDLEKEEEDYEQFLDDIEHDRELRSNINLYKAPGSANVPSRNDKMVDDDEDEGNDDDIQLEELLEEMNLNDGDE